MIDVSWHPYYLENVPKKALEIFEAYPELTYLYFSILKRPNFYSVSAKVLKKYLSVNKITAETQTIRCPVCNKKTLQNVFLTLKPSLIKIWNTKSISCYDEVVVKHKYPKYLYTIGVNLSSWINYKKEEYRLVYVCSLGCEQKLFEELRFFLVSNG